MNTTSLMFRLKLQYKSENQTTGEIEKTKTEILVQCGCYTNAEEVAYSIMEQYHMDKFEPCTYDIIKTKIEPTDIYGNETMKVDYSYDIDSLYQHYFANEEDGLYEVETIVFGDKEAKEKDHKHTFYIPAVNVADAMNKARTILQNMGYNLNDCLIPSAKLDKAEWIYLKPTTSEQIYNQ